MNSEKVVPLVPLVPPPPPPPSPPGPPESPLVPLVPSLRCFWTKNEFWKSSPPSPPYPQIFDPPPPPFFWNRSEKSRRLVENAWAPSALCVLFDLPSPPSRSPPYSPLRHPLPITPFGPPCPTPKIQFEIKFNFSSLNSDWNQKHHCMLTSYNFCWLSNVGNAVIRIPFFMKIISRINLIF